MTTKKITSVGRGKSAVEVRKQFVALCLWSVEVGGAVGTQVD